MEYVILTLALCVNAERNLAEWQRFPSERHAFNNVWLAHEYACQLTQASNIVGGIHRDRLRKMADDAMEAQHAWALLREIAVSKSYGSREQSSRQLLELIGPEAFYSGSWPSPIPPWHR